MSPPLKGSSEVSCPRGGHPWAGILVSLMETLLPKLEKQFHELVTELCTAQCKDGVQVQPHTHL